MSQSNNWFKEEQEKKIQQEAINWNKEHMLKCPQCGSTRVRIKAGMMCDLYTCNDCNLEWK